MAHISKVTFFWIRLFVIRLFYISHSKLLISKISIFQGEYFIKRPIFEVANFERDFSKWPIFEVANFERDFSKWPFLKRSQAKKKNPDIFQVNFLR